MYVRLCYVIKMQETSLIDYFSSTFLRIIKHFVKPGGKFVGTLTNLILCPKYAQFILILMILHL